ncbi:hypothetical protein JEQ12_010057 [Ovis aries]|uniref:Uncharacterized protein n=1 Tax=Ovis aries TaxID=9940 RepID=A0A836AC91_SHEEP|nr:hypothetical protein JEQ12_010057 [Ovis aries]
MCNSKRQKLLRNDQYGDQRLPRGHADLRPQPGTKPIGYTTKPFPPPSILTTDRIPHKTAPLKTEPLPELRVPQKAGIQGDIPGPSRHTMPSSPP